MTITQLEEGGKFVFLVTEGGYGTRCTLDRWPGKRAAKKIKQILTDDINKHKETQWQKNSTKTT